MTSKIPRVLDSDGELLRMTTVLEELCSFPHPCVDILTPDTSKCNYLERVFKGKMMLL